MAYAHPSSPRYTKLYRYCSERTSTSCSSSAFRVAASGMSSPSSRPTTKAAPAAANIGRANRWNETPPAFAAVISE